MKNVHVLRHEKEKNYYTFMMVVSVIVWLFCLVGVLAALVFCLPLIVAFEPVFQGRRVRQQHSSQ